jgi:hypothetical protein
MNTTPEQPPVYKTPWRMDPALRNHGEAVVQQASCAEKLPIIKNPSWINQVPYLGGIYVLWRKEVESWIPIYVGESANLWDRLDEMTRLGRHNALWKLVDKEGVEPIRNVSIVDSPEVNGLHVSFIQLPVGRKEAEEFLIAKWRETLINKSDKRFKRRTDWEAFDRLKNELMASDPDASREDQIKEILSKLNVQSHEWILIHSQHDGPCEGELFGDREPLVCILANLLTCHCDIEAVYHRGSPISDSEMRSLTQEAMDGLGPMSRARAEGKF